MACRADAESALRSAGRRVTGARVAVIEALKHSGGHLSPAQVVASVLADLPHLDVSTVYRTLSSLADARIVSESYIGHRGPFYEWLGSSPHHHLRCNSCVAVSVLDPSVVSRLAGEIGRTHQFQVDPAHMVLEGICRKCARNSDT